MTPQPHIFLIRHGETEWSKAGRHTGTTDIGLTENGERQADALGAFLEHLSPDLVITSPLVRATQTCRRAGFDTTAVVDARLAEWDYGTAEGRTTAEMRTSNPHWSVWSDPIVNGESLAAVTDRADSLIDTLSTTDGTVLAFGHAHILRILAARWCTWPATEGEHLRLDPASISELGRERESPVIRRWNWVPAVGTRFPAA